MVGQSHGSLHRGPRPVSRYRRTRSEWADLRTAWSLSVCRTHPQRDGVGQDEVVLPADVDPERASAFAPPRLMAQLLQGNSSYVCEVLLAKLDYLTEHTYTQLPPGVAVYIETFVQQLLFYFAQPLFRVTGYELALVRYHDVISNLVALSSARTTDAVLETLLYQGRDNAAKVLILWNARCRLALPYDQVRQTVPALFGPWFIAWYTMAFSGLCEERVHAQLYQHQRYLLQVDPAQGLFRGHRDLLPLYFAATYVDDASEPAAHAHIWDAIRHYHQVLGQPYAITHRPRRRR